MSSLEERARANALENDLGGWGYRVALEVGEGFQGRYRGSEVATGGEYGDQTLFLFWDQNAQTCYMRGHASLVRKMESASPGIGDSIFVFRHDDYQSQGGTGYAYGVAAEPNEEPLPEGDDW